MPLIFKKHVTRAVENVTSFGDTDVFPFPFENWLFRERPNEVAALILEFDQFFDELIDSYPPQFESTLAPVGYSGFRWVTQIDPFWNVYLLSMIIANGKALEAARIPISRNRVHSYRFVNDGANLWNKDFGWHSFMRASYAASERFSYVVATDIAEFYRRIGHHRIENALEHVIKNQVPDRIIRILSLFSNDASYGLPIGGPAARLISEITINQVDKILEANSVEFCRFADDYHLFSNSLDDAYKSLQQLSELLINNQGLTLQRSKTRIMSSAEFQHSFPKHMLADELQTDSQIESDTVRLLRLSVHYDPYSATAPADYAALKSELDQIDVVGLLTAEAQKSQISIHVTRKIVSALTHLTPSMQVSAVQTLLENKEQFFPIMITVLQVIRSIISKLSDGQERDRIASLVRDAARSGSHVFAPDLHRAYVVRILSEVGTEDDITYLNSVYQTAAPFVRKDVTLSFAKHRYWYLLSNLRSKVGAMSAWEKRAFLFASYAMGDEGKHWREKVVINTPSIDKLMREWIGSLKNNDNLTVRL